MWAAQSLLVAVYILFAPESACVRVTAEADALLYHIGFSGTRKGHTAESDVRDKIAPIRVFIFLSSAAFRFHGAVVRAVLFQSREISIESCVQSGVLLGRVSNTCSASS